jgi:hypothetical protein
METRGADDPQVVTKCNVCGQGEYAETNRTEIETIAEPVYVASSEEQEVSIEEEII